MHETEQPTIRLQGVAKRFGGNRVLEDVTLDVYRGQHMALIGSAASGKTV
ncbi:MAG TPA: ABC transporter ATP-binding protein, partial [Alphaproteobacteria bacterium]|nr:ABC transporter ATP-binding protein [Alphaproteobacteria bacterium]